MVLWHTGLGGDGPGLLLHDLRRGAEGVADAVGFLRALDGDVLVLLDIDHDLHGVAVAALAERLDRPYWLAPMPNTGVQQGLDLDRDGRRAEPEDAWGHGRFPGAGGIAVLSRWPLRLGPDHTGTLWAAGAPDHWPQTPDGATYFTEDEAAVLPLWGVGAFEVDVLAPDAPPLRLLVWHASPPAFDGPEARNRLRNAAQVQALAQRIAPLAVEGAFALIGNTNLDAERGNGAREQMAALLAHPALQDPMPMAPHPGLGRPDTATAWWPNGPGALRVSHILPDARLTVQGSGMVWPAEGRHAAVWVDLVWPR